METFLSVHCIFIMTSLLCIHRLGPQHYHHVPARLPSLPIDAQSSSRARFPGRVASSSSSSSWRLSKRNSLRDSAVHWEMLGEERWQGVRKEAGGREVRRKYMSG